MGLTFFCPVEPLGNEWWMTTALSGLALNVIFDQGFVSLHPELLHYGALPLENLIQHIPEGVL